MCTRRSRNSISSNTVEGQKLTTFSEIYDEIVGFYQNLLGKEDNHVAGKTVKK